LTSAWLLLHEVALSFTFVARSRSCIKPLALITRDEYLQPHFEVSRPTQVLDLDRIVQCAEGDGLCSLDEMNEMIQGKMRKRVVRTRIVLATLIKTLFNLSLDYRS